MSTSLYGTPPNQDVSSSNSTSLYGGAATPIPDSSGNLVVRGDLVVLSGNILTTATTGNIFPTNATTINFGGSATTVNIGAGTGTTTINNNLNVGGSLTAGGTITGPGADFGNITIAIADDNTITTTTGNLNLTAAAGGIVNIVSETTAPTSITRNSGANNVSVRSLSLDVQSSGTPAVGFGNTLEWEVEAQPGNTERAGYIAVDLTDITPGSEDFAMRFGLMQNGAPYTTKMALDSTGSLSLNNDLTVGGDAVNLAQGTVIGYSENNNRLNRLNIRSTTGNSSGLRVQGPNTSTSSQSFITAYSTSDLNNGRSINLNARADALANPYRITINSTTGGVVGNANGVLGFYDNATLIATVNPAGVLQSTDLTTKAYVDSAVANIPTYDTNVAPTTGGVNLQLRELDPPSITIVGSTKFLGGSNVTISETSPNEITISAPDTNTTYTIDASSTTGGANFNLVGSDSTTDTVKFSSGTNVTVAQTSANEITISSVDTDTKYNIDASSTTGGANLNLTGSDSTTDTVKFASGTGVTVSQVNANEMSIAIGQAVGTTDAVVFDTVQATTSISTDNIYSITSPLAITSVQPGGGLVQITADDVSPGTDTGVLTVDPTSLIWTHTAGILTPGSVNGTWSYNINGTTSFPNYTFPYADGTSGQVLKTNGSGTLTWQSDTNTTYTIDASSTTGGANLNLVGSDSTTDTVKFASGTGVTVSQTNANEMSIAIGQAVGTGDSPVFAGVTGGNISVGVATDNTIASTDVNGNIALAPNGTGIVTVSTATDTNITDANYVTGLIWGTRNTAFSIPTTSLTTLSGTNGFQAVSSAGGANGYAAMIGIIHYQGDTTAGVNASATLNFRGALGTNSAPTAVPINNVIASINGDGYATTNFANVIATTGSGGGTTSITPIQLQFYARETFADSAGTVTNAGCGFRVRGFQTATAMSVANRLVFVDHHATSATYKTNTFNVQPSTSTNNYMQLSTASGNINQDTLTIRNNAGTITYASWDGASGGLYTTRRTTTGTPGVAESRPGFNVELSRTDQATPNNGDSISFRQRVRGSNNTFYTVSDMSARYSTTGDNEYNLLLANGDQTTGTFSGLNTFSSSITQTRIRAGTASATPGGSSVNDIIIANNTRVTLTRPLELRASGGNTIEFSAGSTPAVQTYVLPQAYPSSNNRVLASDTSGTMSWVPLTSISSSYGEFAYANAAGFNIPAQNTIYIMPLDTTLNNSGVTISGTGQINVNVAGWFKIFMSLQSTLTVSNQPAQFDFWLRKNGADVANSKTQVDLLKDQKSVTSMHWLVNSDGNDYWEIAYVGTTANFADIDFPTIAATTTPYVSPVAPALIVNVIPVGA